MLQSAHGSSPGQGDKSMSAGARCQAQQRPCKSSPVSIVVVRRRHVTGGAEGARLQALLDQQGTPGSRATRSPTLSRFTPGPTSTTVLQHSRPWAP